MPTGVRAILDRRELLLAGAGAAAGLAAGAAARAQEARPFSLAYAPHPGQFAHSAGPDLVDQIAFAADHGFTAWEDNAMASRPVAEQERIAAALAARGMRMGVFVAGMVDDFWREQPVLTGDDNAPREAFLSRIRDAVDVARRVGATWTTVVPGFADPRSPAGFQTARLIDLLRRAADLYAPHGLTMALEPLNTRVDHPGVFLTSVAQAYALCAAVDSPACAILFDVYHEQIESGHLLATLDAAWDQVVYVQVGDTPGRAEPTTGEINFRALFAHLRAKGYDGVVGMEHGAAGAGAAGERALIAAYRSVDPGAAETRTPHEEGGAQ